MKKTLFFLIAFPFCCIFSDICYFIPPKDWKPIESSKLSDYVYAGFIGKGKSFFNPSINLASEETQATLQQYVSAAKKTYESDKNIIAVRDLGKINTQLKTPATLLELTKKSSFGEIKILQMITIKDKQAFILSSSVLKEDLIKTKDDIFNAFRSLKITENLVSEISDPVKRDFLEKKLLNLKEKKEKYKNFEKHMQHNYDELGSYWKMLMLKYANDQINIR